jgi:hypothetical protein
LLSNNAFGCSASSFCLRTVASIARNALRRQCPCTGIRCVIKICEVQRTVHVHVHVQWTCSQMMIHGNDKDAHRCSRWSRTGFIIFRVRRPSGDKTVYSTYKYTRNGITNGGGHTLPVSASCRVAGRAFGSNPLAIPVLHVIIICISIDW